RKSCNTEQRRKSHIGVVCLYYIEKRGRSVTRAASLKTRKRYPTMRTPALQLINDAMTPKTSTTRMTVAKVVTTTGRTTTATTTATTTTTTTMMMTTMTTMTRMMTTMMMGTR
ncbi:hypothetical protein V1477_017191, partial [Vespula maculifrons]